MSRSRQRGFTLLELMIVIAVIAILAIIAYPAFTDQARKGRRAEAKEALAKVALAQEKWRVNKSYYAASPASVSIATATVNGYYNLSITRSTTGSCANGNARTVGNNFTVTATAAGAQLADTKCATLTLTNECGAVSKSSTPAGSSCW